MKSTSNPTVLAEVVADIIQQMTEADKATVVNTAEEDLIEFHFGWDTSIRNYYNLRQNQALLRATGTENPDDASMVISKSSRKRCGIRVKPIGKERSKRIHCIGVRWNSV